MTTSPFVFVVDDDPAIRDSLRLLLKSTGLDCAVFESAEAFVAGFVPRHPACLLVDVRMPGMSGLDLHRHLKREGVALPVVIITGHGDIGMAVQALKEGAADFIEKPCDERRLLASVREALAKDEEQSEQAIELVELHRRLATLSEREREVMGLVVEGCLNKVVAGRLGISDRTVEIHKSRVMQKMQARTLSELIRMALRLEYGQRGT